MSDYDCYDTNMQHDGAADREIDKLEMQLQDAEAEVTRLNRRIEELEAALEGRTVSCCCGDELPNLRAACRGLLDFVNEKYPDKPHDEWTCPHMTLISALIGFGANTPTDSAQKASETSRPISDRQRMKRA